LIYLSAELQDKLMPLFHYALNPGGILLLGNAESVGGFTNLFKSIDSKARLYQRIEIGSSSGISFPTKRFPVLSNVQEEPKMANIQANFQSQADQFLLQNLSPAAVLVNADGDITYFNGRTGKYLEPASGKANLNIYAMARDGLRYDLANALKTVNRNHGTVTLAGLQVEELNGAAQTVNVTVQVIDKPAVLQGMVMITFSDAALPPPGKMQRSDRNAKQRQELEQAYAELRTAREEMQISKEELTSTNEELQTVNAELQSKVEDLSSINSDLQNLLNSTEIASIFLDSALRVRRFTDQVTRMFKLIPGDVGRPLSDIANDLDYQELQEDMREVLRTLIFIEKQLPTRDGRWFKVRIMPYRTVENVIDGVVITFTDITAFKSMEAELRGK
jgi:chemotaxis protein methyltransferase CheR/two-component system CheB/CheR fusion protein